MYLKETIGIIIIVLNLGGIGFIIIYLMMALKKARDRDLEKANLESELQNKKETEINPAKNISSTSKEQDLLDDIDLSEFDDWKLDDFD